MLASQQCTGRVGRGGERQRVAAAGWSGGGDEQREGPHKVVGGNKVWVRWVAAMMSGGL